LKGADWLVFWAEVEAKRVRDRVRRARCMVVVVCWGLEATGIGWSVRM
jgi:hypothetical protein